MTFISAMVLVLVGIALLINLPIYASIISVPIALARRGLVATRGEVPEAAARKEAKG